MDHHGVALPVDAEHEVLGASEFAPTSSTRRATPSSLSSPNRVGSSRKPLAGCSPWTQSRHSARKTSTVSLSTCPGSVNAGRIHAARIRNRVAAW